MFCLGPEALNLGLPLAGCFPLSLAQASPSSCPSCTESSPGATTLLLANLSTSERLEALSYPNLLGLLQWGQRSSLLSMFLVMFLLWGWSCQWCPSRLGNLVPPKTSHVGNVQLQRHQEVWIDARNDVVGEPPGWRSKLRHRDQWLSQEKNKGCLGPVDPGEAPEPPNPKDIWGP